MVSEKNAEAPLRSQGKFMTPHKAALSQTPLEPASDRAGEDVLVRALAPSLRLCGGLATPAQYSISEKQGARPGPPQADTPDPEEEPSQKRDKETEKGRSSQLRTHLSPLFPNRPKEDTEE